MIVHGSSRKRALVAGGAGFIGSHLVNRLLSGGWHVVVLDNLQTGREANLAHFRGVRELTFVEGDVIDSLPAPVTRQRFDQIYNLACAASPPRYQADPEHTMLTNVLGTRNLLRLAEVHGARFLQTSTSEVYGDPEMHPQREDYRGWVNCTGPRACYDEGKRAAETLAFDFDRAERADVRVARIFNTYGPNMDPDDGRVISNVICQALLGEPITVYGDGSQTRSFCYVDDLLDGFQALMEYEGNQPGPINLGNEVELTVRELVERIVAITGTESTVTYEPLPQDDPRRRRPDISLARELLGWEPKVELQTGLETTAAYFAEELRCAPQRFGRPDVPALAAAE
jgi:UDP-glucuronate decarboxylase